LSNCLQLLLCHFQDLRHRPDRVHHQQETELEVLGPSSLDLNGEGHPGRRQKHKHLPSTSPWPQQNWNALTRPLNWSNLTNHRKWSFNEQQLTKNIVTCCLTQQTDQARTTELHRIIQEPGQPVQGFLANPKSKGRQCNMKLVYSSSTCEQANDFYEPVM
jgi:hypothetical protein